VLKHSFHLWRVNNKTRQHATARIQQRADLREDLQVCLHPDAVRLYFSRNALRYIGMTAYKHYSAIIMKVLQQLAPTHEVATLCRNHDVSVEDMQHLVINQVLNYLEKDEEGKAPFAYLGDAAVIRACERTLARYRKKKRAQLVHKTTWTTFSQVWNMCYWGITGRQSPTHSKSWNQFPQRPVPDIKAWTNLSFEAMGMPFEMFSNQFSAATDELACLCAATSHKSLDARAGSVARDNSLLMLRGLIEVLRFQPVSVLKEHRRAMGRFHNSVSAYAEDGYPSLARQVDEGGLGGEDLTRRIMVRELRRNAHISRCFLSTIYCWVAGVGGTVDTLQDLDGLVVESGFEVIRDMKMANETYYEPDSPAISPRNSVDSGGTKQATV
jgi:hypothetical protein